MSSKKVEDHHIELIKDLLTESGLVCVRSPRLSEESEEEEEEGDEGTGEEEFVPEEQAGLADYNYQIPEEMVAEEMSDLFPTPSLRRIIPERIRRIEAYNRLWTLPDHLETAIDPDEIPRIIYTPPKVYIEKLAKLTGCKKVPNSLAEFWFLDTLANLLRRAQEDDFDKPTQAVLILWFCEWMKEMQHFDAATRERMMKRFRDNMLSAARVIAEEDLFPTPNDAGVFYKVETKSPSLSHVPETKKTSRPDIVAVDVGEFVFECALKDLTKIIHYLYDLIGTDFQYNLIRSIFTFGPENRIIDGPYQIEVPKRLYVPLKPKKEGKPGSAKKADKDKSAGGKADKGKKNEEYLALLQFIDMSNKEEKVKEEEDRELWNRRNSILPLNFAATPEFFDKYWPPMESPAVIATPTPAAPPAKGKKK